MSNIFFKDEFRQSLEKSSCGKLTVLYDDMGYPSIMYKIPLFFIADKNFYDISSLNVSITNFLNGKNKDDYGQLVNTMLSPYSSFDGDNNKISWSVNPNIDITGSNPDLLKININSIDSIHPAFTIGDNTNFGNPENDQNNSISYEIYVGAYKSSWMGDGSCMRLVSLPGNRVATGTFNDMVNECFKKNIYFDGSNRCEGWHMMTAYEYSAMIMDSLANDSSSIYNTYTILGLLQSYFKENFEYPEMNLKENIVESILNCNMSIPPQKLYYRLRKINNDTSQWDGIVLNNVSYITGLNYSSEDGNLINNNRNSEISIHDLGIGGLEYIDGIKNVADKVVFWDKNHYYKGPVINTTLDTSVYFNSYMYMWAYRPTYEGTAYNYQSANGLSIIKYSDRSDDGRTTNGFIKPNVLCSNTNFGDYGKLYFINSKFSDSSYYGYLDKEGSFLRFENDEDVKKRIQLFNILLLDGELYRTWCNYSDKMFNSFSSDRIFYKTNIDDSSFNYVYARFGDYAWNPFGGVFSFTNLAPNEMYYRDFRPNDSLKDTKLQWTKPYNNELTTLMNNIPDSEKQDIGWLDNSCGIYSSNQFGTLDDETISWKYFVSDSTESYDTNTVVDYTDSEKRNLNCSCRLVYIRPMFVRDADNVFNP